jgi:uroporphyrinogen-III synthase
MNQGLAGRTVALAEGRQLEELVQMLEREGAVALRCPMLGILDAPDAGPVLAWLRELVANGFDYVVLMTGEALARLLGFAERAGLRDQVVSALGRTRIVARGPKPVRVLKDVGLKPTAVALIATSEGVIDCLRAEPLEGRTVGVTLYGQPNSALVQALEFAGAKVQTVMPYVYAPATDATRIKEVIHLLAQGKVDAIVFTSAGQVDRLFDVAAQQGASDILGEGLAKTRVAAVGPIVADNLRQRGVGVAVCPEHGFVMKNLVQQLKCDFESR